jgi:hypothetical protein
MSWAIAKEWFKALKSGPGWILVEEWLADKQPETLHLDFKTRAFEVDKTTGQRVYLDAGKLQDADRKNLAKTISAFANTEGGMIVFGVSTKKDKQSDIDFASGLDLVPDLLAFRQRVEGVIKDVVNPNVSGIDLCHVEKDNSGSGMLAILVPPSIGGPHRANMGDVKEIYFHRSASRSDVMPHSTLAALFGRVAQPQLILRMHVWSEELMPPSSNCKVLYSLDLINAGRGTAKQPAVCFFEAERRHRGAWGEILNSGTMPRAGWSRNTTSTERRQTAGKREGQVLLSSEPTIVVYPGASIRLIDAGTLHPGIRFNARVDTAVRGAIYAVDSQTIDFSGVLDYEADVDESKSFEFGANLDDSVQP